MFALGWLPRVIAIDSGLINLTKAPPTAWLWTSPSSSREGISHTDPVWDPSVWGSLRGNSFFYFHCRNPCNSGRHKSNPAALSNRLRLDFFFPSCSDNIHLLLPSVSANLKYKKLTSICKSFIIPHHIIHFVRAHSEILPTATGQSLDLNSLC